MARRALHSVDAGSRAARDESGDRLEEREVLTEKAETVKLKNVVPPIRFEPGVSEIPPGYIQQLRKVLDDMRTSRT